MEVKKQKEVILAAEKLRREKWINEKTQQIKVEILGRLSTGLPLSFIVASGRLLHTVAKPYIK